MKLVNTDGMAFIGPGSEWFWTAVSGIILAITFIAIYRQLRLQRAGAAIEQLNGLMREWSSERLCRAKLTILLALQGGAPSEKLPNRAVAIVGFFWQEIGFLVRGGHMDRQLVYQHLGDQVQMWRLWIRPDAWEDFVWLADEFAVLDNKRGQGGWLDREAAELLPNQIEPFREAIEIEDGLRTVTVRLTPTPIPVRAERAPSVSARDEPGDVRRR